MKILCVKLIFWMRFREFCLDRKYVQCYNKIFDKFLTLVKKLCVLSLILYCALRRTFDAISVVLFYFLESKRAHQVCDTSISLQSVFSSDELVGLQVKGQAVAQTHS